MRSSAIIALLCFCALSQGFAQTFAPGPSGPSSPDSIGAFIQVNPNLTYFLAAAQAAGLASTLYDPSTVYTVLAPTNTAISDVLAVLGLSRQDLLSSPHLGSLLTYHIIPPGFATKSTEVTDGEVLPTLLTGSNLVVSLSGGQVTFVGNNNNATVISADNLAGQSLVHIVDDFLLPLDIETNSAPVQAPNLALAQQTLGFASTTGRKLLLAD